MLNFVFILLIIFEIVISTYCVNKILFFEKKVLFYNEKILDFNFSMLKTHGKIKPIIFKISKVIKILTNRHVINIRKIIKIFIYLVEMIILVKSIKKYKKDFKSFKKKIFSQSLKFIIGKIFTKIIMNL